MSCLKCDEYSEFRVILQYNASGVILYAHSMNARDLFYQKSDIIVFDTEFTTWEGSLERNWSGEGEYRELVQIVAKRINLQTETEVDSFSVLMTPTINPTLSEYFIELTGITQSDIDSEGVSFSTAFQKFLTWSSGIVKYSYSSRLHSKADYEVIRENSLLYGLSTFPKPNDYKNIAPVFVEVGVDVSEYSSGELCRAFSLDLAGHVHNAMHDVESIVQSLYVTKKILTQ